MKTLKEQIIQILKKNFQKVNEEGLGFLETNIVKCNSDLIVLFKDYYPKEFVISILEVINEGYYRPEDIDDLFNRWENENRTE